MKKYTVFARVWVRQDKPVEANSPEEAQRIFAAQTGLGPEDIKIEDAIYCKHCGQPHSLEQAKLHEDGACLEDA